MCFFDSPVGRCEAVRELVLLDETQRECAGEHGCAPGFDCPLQGCFAEFSGVCDPARLPCARRAQALRPPPREARPRRAATRSEMLVVA